ncbi:Ryanodine receptor 1 [Frankliniella fusca]|uniref:Ryanodine receptor 1 n=1 Tax=Frankliniella fusca TaxID=407009 RepID=A0AAE1HFJ9_9NEOP|nr:Ryanodine receptor 1 [Frankliniella fusca]
MLVCINVTFGFLQEQGGRPISYEMVSKKPEKEFRRLTGLSKHNFLVVYKFVGGDNMFDQMKYQYNSRTPNRRKKQKRPDRLTHHDRLLLTLMRLRRGFSIEDLALLFHVSSALIGDIFYAVVNLLYHQFLPLRERMFTTRAAQPTSVLPTCLKSFKNFRATIDTTEVKIQVPYNYKQQGNTYSKYKSANVVNYLVACNCWGAVSFISPGYEGSISDVELFRVSGICDLLHPDDVLLVDRGFTIKEQTDALRVKLVRPAFLGDRDVFSQEENLMNSKISAARIHIERCIRKLKCFHILKRMTNNMIPMLDQIVFVIACLVNFDPPNIQALQERDM